MDHQLQNLAGLRLKRMGFRGAGLGLGLGLGLALGFGIALGLALGLGLGIALGLALGLTFGFGHDEYVFFAGVDALDMG